MQRLAGDCGAEAAKGEAGPAVRTELRVSELEQQAGGQRAVHDEPAIALDLAGIGQVVVDAMRVEGQRRVAEQQARIGCDFAVRIPAGGIEAFAVDLGR